MCMIRVVTFRRIAGEDEAGDGLERVALVAPGVVEISARLVASAIASV